MNKLLTVGSTLAIIGWTAISIIRFLNTKLGLEARLVDYCPIIEGRYVTNECKAEVEAALAVERSIIWEHWYILTIILCLLWIMVRLHYNRNKNP